jgi:hypothetical protein
MAISATIVDIRGLAVTPIIEEILFSNDTVNKNLVTLATDIKSDTVFTENDNSVTAQAFASGAPTSSGTFGLVDTLITPTKIMYYQEFDPNALRSSRFNRTMKPGAWEIESSEFGSVVLKSYGNLISEDLQSKFWNGATSATRTAVAALTPGTAQNQVSSVEQALVASGSASLLDGVATRMIYNGGALGTRIKVLGTTISSTNIQTEYAKIYAAIPARVINGAVKPFIYAPYSHKQLINIYNVSATYRDLFAVTNLGQPTEAYFYNGIQIQFVPLAENVVSAARPDYIYWCTDLVSDINKFEVNKIAFNREDMFVKNIMTIFAHVVNQAMNVLYVG